jgi:nucleoside-diphosphate kinase
MAIERTLSIIKPDAVEKNIIGKIYTKIENAGLKIVAAAMAQLDQSSAEAFYDVHRKRPFFRSLVKFMSSGPIMIQVLEGENAVAKYREIMGATDPKQAAPGTIRAEFADSIEANAVHGSDSLENAQNEIAFFFGDDEDGEDSEMFEEFEYSDDLEDGEEGEEELYSDDEDEDDGHGHGGNCGHKH